MSSEILEHDHKQLAEVLRELTAGLKRGNEDQTFQLLDLFWARLAVHIRAENLCLFPAILEAPREIFLKGGDLPTFEETKTILERLKADHNFFMDELAKAVKTFREILAKDKSRQQVDVDAEFAGIRDRVEAVSLRLESHNVLEEDQVYKWPGLILSESELQDLQAAIRHELENLPGRFAEP